MEIIDDFLEQTAFDELQTFMMSDDIFWIYNSTIDYPDDVNKFMFVHMFYDTKQHRYPFAEKMQPILEIINPISCFRIKANLLTKTPDIVENEFHVDLPMPKEKLKQWTTSIFYVNTNNGYTKFEDGTKVESVANRMVIFPSNLKHKGTSCTDEKIRVVINFNYFSKYFCE